MTPKLGNPLTQGHDPLREVPTSTSSTTVYMLYDFLLAKSISLLLLLA